MSNPPYGYFYEIEQRFEGERECWIVVDGNGVAIAVCYAEEHARLIATGLNEPRIAA